MLQSDAISVLSLTKKRYCGTKNDITGQKTISRDKKYGWITGNIVFMSPCYRPIKAQVCDNPIYYMSIEIYVKYSAGIKFVFHCILYFSHVKFVV